MPVAQRGVAISLLSLATTGTGIPASLNGKVDNLRLHARGLGVISAGTIVVEEAQSADYAGVWSTIYTFSALALTGGAEQVVHLAGTFGAVRARVTANVTGGGTFSLDLVAD